VYSFAGVFQPSRTFSSHSEENNLAIISFKENTPMEWRSVENAINIQKCLLLILVLAGILGAPLSSSATPTVTLSPSLPSPQVVGTVLTWTATATDSDPGTLMYSFSVGAEGGALALVRDFSPTNIFRSYPALREGTYQVEVTARNSTTLETGTATQIFVATPIASAGNPVVISPTANPLVALFSAAPCTAGQSMRVEFQNASQASPQLTPLQACDGKSMNFYVAGMYANTQYSMTGEYVVSGHVVGYTSTQMFTTGAIPSSVTIPTFTVISPAPAVSASEPILLHSYFLPTITMGTDLSGNILWYYQPWDGQVGNMIRAQTGGFFWYIGFGNGQGPYTNLLRKVDVAGNTVVETNVGRINEQLVAAGQQPLNGIDHELRTMGDGNILMIGSLDKILGPTIQNGADILYNELVVLNPGLQLKWSWNAVTCGNCATELPPTRAAILGETCTPGQSGCPPITPPNTIANDWLHGNAAELAADGSLLMSLRHQDWILKIDYNYGTGTGNILWRMGLDGDFTIIGDANDTYPWFSHQHDPEWAFGTTYLSVFDNGNTRISENPGEFSRGQLLNIDQTTMTATLIKNLDIGAFCVAVGTSQVLIDQTGKVTGLHYECGISENFAGSQSQSYYDNGMLNLQSSAQSYRSAQMRDMYSPQVGAN
jgi:arylsulfate sulfotransferase